LQYLDRFAKIRKENASDYPRASSKGKGGGERVKGVIVGQYEYIGTNQTVFSSGLPEWILLASGKLAE